MFPNGWAALQSRRKAHLRQVVSSRSSWFIPLDTLVSTIPAPSRWFTASPAIWGDRNGATRLPLTTPRSSHRMGPRWKFSMTANATFDPGIKHYLFESSADFFARVIKLLCALAIVLGDRPVCAFRPSWNPHSSFVCWPIRLRPTITRNCRASLTSPSSPDPGFLEGHFANIASLRRDL